MVKISKVNDNQYEIQDELTVSSLWLSDLEKELCKKTILLASIEYTNKDEELRVKFNDDLKEFLYKLEKDNRIDYLNKLTITVEDLVLLKFLYDTSSENIFQKLRAKIKAW